MSDPQRPGDPWQPDAPDEPDPAAPAVADDDAVAAVGHHPGAGRTRSRRTSSPTS